ncbi:TPA: hypothetical protein PXR26_003868 [Yersinia enterocolitica]|nr:hypothetical protein [Yersinia enterocolitica]HDL8337837.1 hypothetical protein [Yersinia enterocolitica]HDL8341904.1 hypothetical protein [Yersinia enterocolitica]HDL8345643.1 hypothetical protein [Yersinia enterocolitica]HDL8350237.1 hypothetical protein [Yersinia enterocolitica]
MELRINNSQARESIDTCFSELNKIGGLIELLGGTSHPAPYLTRYSVIKACGTIEFSFKTIISDHQYSDHSEQIRRFIDEKFRNSSMNPSYDNICKSLKSFDETWCVNFRNTINANIHKSRLLDSLKSLNTARNEFAHGQSPTTSFASVQTYFTDCVEIIQIMEDAILGGERVNAEIEDEGTTTI